MEGEDGIAYTRRLLDHLAGEIAYLDQGSGDPIVLDRLKGRVVYVDFWASWCGACEQEKPSLMRMANDLVGQDFDIVSVASDLDWASVERTAPPDEQAASTFTASTPVKPT